MGERRGGATGTFAELWRKGALELAELIAGGKVTSTEVVTAHLERIEQVNGHLNAVVRVLGESALAAAAEADQAVAEGRPLGPLHGVPCTVKENIDLAGTPTTHGLPALAEAVTTLDAPTVERLRGAGAIPIGRTNLPDVGLRVHTDSSLHGLTRNPWHPDRTAGGSSGGEGAALASGMSPIGLGNDLGGSLRNPAHCCGVASIKPTPGRVPYATTIPPEDAGIMSQLMAVEGVMARRVADVRAGLRVVAGAHPRDPDSLPVPLDVALPDHRRAAVLAEPPGVDTHPGIAAAVRAAADALADAGYDVVEATPPSYERTIEVWAEALLPDVRAQLPILELVMGDEGRRFLRYAEELYPPIDTDAWAALLIERHALVRAWTSFLDEHLVLLGPIWTQPPFPHGFDVESLDHAVTTRTIFSPVLPANLLGLPAAAVPAGLVDGLPVGVQATAGRFRELAALDAAETIERRLGLPTPIEPVTTARAA